MVGSCKSEFGSEVHLPTTLVAALFFQPTSSLSRSRLLHFHSATFRCFPAFWIQIKSDYALVHV